MANSNNLLFNYVEQSQSQKEVTVNNALATIDAILNTAIIDKDLATPPSLPAEGDVYIVAATATDDWLGQENKLAYYLNNAWAFITPKTGLSMFVSDEGLNYLYNGIEWVIAGINKTDGEFWRMESLRITESSLSGASVTSNLIIPNRSIVFAVHTRVSEAITGATSFSVGDGSSASKFGSSIGIALDSTNIGVATPTPYFSDTNIVLTPAGGNFSGGAVDLTLHYMSFRGNWNF